jgi:catechol 2,3-dioxygenase-like lactoylglutathione lyase family enzyme
LRRTAGDDNLRPLSKGAAVPASAPILDHVVVDVRDRMDEAAETYRALGFRLTPRGHHTLGSMNHLAMFATDYMELLGFGPAGANRPELAPFPVGLNGLVFKTDNADAIHDHAEGAGLPILPVQAFSRPVELDGKKQDAKFRTTRLDPARIAMGRVYFCEHLTPELVWRPEWQSHPNGARAISRVVVATPDPRRSSRLFRGLFGEAAVTKRDGRCFVAAGTARVELMPPPAVAAEFGDAVADPAGRGEYLAALEFAVGALADTAQALQGVAGLITGSSRVTVPARAAFNTTLAFSAAA